MERSNFSIRRSKIQKLYVPKNAPRAIPANIESYGENPQPNVQTASKKRTLSSALQKRDANLALAVNLLKLFSSKESVHRPLNEFKT